MLDLPNVYGESLLYNDDFKRFFVGWALDSGRLSKGFQSGLE
jgi:hypothetical protein